MREEIMGKEDYSKAFKLGKKDYQSRMLRGVKPTLQVLDDIMPEKGSYSEASLGLVQIPIDQIVGTKTVGRSSPLPGILWRAKIGKNTARPSAGGGTASFSSPFFFLSFHFLQFF